MNERKRLASPRPRGSHMGKRAKQSTASGRVRSIALGVLAGLASAGVLLLLGSAVAYADSDPNRMIAPMAPVLNCLCALVGGLVAARCRRGESFLCGGVCGLILMLTFSALAFTAPSLHTASGVLLSILLRVLMVGFGIVGGMMGIPKSRGRGHARSK